MRRAKKRNRNQTHVTKSGAKALAAGAAIAAGTQAYAAPIRFDNPAESEPGHYHWWEDWLDITLAATSQTGSGGIKFHQSWTYYPTANPSWVRGAEGLAELQTINLYYNSFLAPFDSSQVIPAGGEVSFGDLAYIAYYGGSSSLPALVSTYIGTRIRLDGQWHYGWIGVNFNGYSWESLETFAWGYETEAGVPIKAGAVPEPGTLAMLALGFVAVGVRRR